MGPETAREVLLGVLMPTSDDPKRDREIFLEIMTMDDERIWRHSVGGKRWIVRRRWAVLLH